MVLKDTNVYSNPTAEEKFSTVPHSTILHLGDVVEISQRVQANWVKIRSPVEGWVELYRFIENQTNTNQSKQVSVHLIPYDLLNHSCHSSIRPYGKLDNKIIISIITIIIDYYYYY